MEKSLKPKILLFDIETSPIIAHTWGLFDQNISLNQIQVDWNVLAWCAKWLGSKELMYADQRNARDITDDKKIIKALWKLLDEADIVVTQNGNTFDTKKVNARFIFHGMKPPSSYKKIDTLKLAKKYFGFTSNKLAYMTAKLCTKYKKLEHKNFPGHELWSECLKGNKKAWKEMEKYNKHDVLSLEELYTKLRPWDSSINLNLYSDGLVEACSCGSCLITKNGYCYTSIGKYQRYQCAACGNETKGAKNLLSKEKKASLRRGTSR